MNCLNTYKLNNGTCVHYISADRFKNVNFTVSFSVPLKRPDVTFNALIPAILRRGCKIIPETKDLNTYLDDLYGANISYSVKKRGNYQVIVINFNTVADKYAPNVLPFNKLLSLAGEILFNPLKENDGFNKEYTEREKENLKQYIESIVNDKKEYAKYRLISEMYKDEEYGVFSNGYIEDLPLINSTNLYESYLNLLDKAYTEIFITGPVDRNMCDKFIKDNFEYEKSNLAINPANFGKYNNEIKYINEPGDVTQGKLAIGLRTNITSDCPLYFAMIVMNNLFGGSVHSKLFLNVREKLSLAYYAGSMYDANKGLMLINSGIKFKNYEVALKEIFKQLEDVQNSIFTDQDIEYSKLAIRTSYISAKDSALAMENFYSSQSLRKMPCSIEEMIKNINKVSREDIVNAALTLKPDTVFFLKGSEM